MSFEYLKTKDDQLGKTIAETYTGKYLISTGLLPVTMRRGRMLYETCIFNQWWKLESASQPSCVVGWYSTEEEALRGHSIACETTMFVTRKEGA